MHRSMKYYAYQCGHHEASRQHQNRLHERLQMVAVRDAADAERRYDNAIKHLGAVLADKVLGEYKYRV